MRYNLRPHKGAPDDLVGGIFEGLYFNVGKGPKYLGERKIFYFYGIRKGCF